MSAPTQADADLVATIVERAAKRWPHCKLELAQLVAEQREEIIIEKDDAQRALTNAKEKMSFWFDRAETAEAALAAVRSKLETIKAGHGELGRYEEVRLKNAELLRVLKTISDLWITETTPSSPPDALAERMARLALAATLRKTP